MNSIFIIKSLIVIIQVIFIARFHLEIANVNGFVEPVNSIRKLTNPLVMPVKRLLPFIWAKKAAALLVGFIITAIIVIAVNKAGMANAIITAIVLWINTWISFLQYGMFLFVIGSWIQIPALHSANQLLYSVFQPLLRPIQQVIPSLGGLDFSPIIFLLLLSFAANSFSGLITRLLQ